METEPCSSMTFTTPILFGSSLSLSISTGCEEHYAFQGFRKIEPRLLYRQGRVLLNLYLKQSVTLDFKCSVSLLEANPFINMTYLHWKVHFNSTRPLKIWWYSRMNLLQKIWFLQYTEIPVTYQWEARIFLFHTMAAHRNGVINKHCNDKLMFSNSIQFEDGQTRIVKLNARSIDSALFFPILILNHTVSFFWCIDSGSP